MKPKRTVSAKSLANLRPYKKGAEWTGNAGGRPKSRLLSEAYKRELEKENKDGDTNAELIAKQLVKDARSGKVNSASEIADRVEGKPRQAYEVKLSIMDELAERLEKARKRVK